MYNHKSVPKPPRRSLKGLWADLKIDITEADIAEARREMWPKPSPKSKIRRVAL